MDEHIVERQAGWYGNLVSPLGSKVALSSREVIGRPVAYVVRVHKLRSSTYTKTSGITVICFYVWAAET